LKVRRGRGVDDTGMDGEAATESQMRYSANKSRETEQTERRSSSFCPAVNGVNRPNAERGDGVHTVSNTGLLSPYCTDPPEMYELELPCKHGVPTDHDSGDSSDEDPLVCDIEGDVTSDCEKRAIKKWGDAAGKCCRLDETVAESVVFAAKVARV
jgi:hypothetical protein